MIFYIIGRSSTGKDSVYSRILKSKELNLIPITMYTTRPMRNGEKNGREYFFVTEEQMKYMENDIIESRCYHTTFGDWYYFTSKTVFMENKNYIGIGTLESFKSLKNHFKSLIIPIYIDVNNDLELLQRALHRESLGGKNYKETCRRYIADLDDFSEKNIVSAGIKIRFYNNDLNYCVNDIVDFIKTQLKINVEI